MHLDHHFDVIVIGGGHAGTEAAYAASRMGCRTLLLTQSIETLGQMSCNPSIGGIGKSHLVKEVDALGGAMAIATDEAGIHFKVLNARKGPAVRATRAQADRQRYKQSIRHILEYADNLKIFQQSVEDIILQGNKIQGVITQMGLKFYAPAIILTTGTFLGGKIHIGLSNFQGGRASEAPSNRLAEKLRELPMRVGRLKTGTPPRIDGRSIDYTFLERQAGDEPTPVFSYVGSRAMHPKQVDCFITHTNEKTHDIIRSGLKKSPLFTGVIEGTGPRYCPSIEDKITRFSDKNSHQIFIEPEGLDTPEIYPAGISTSLDFEDQIAFVRSIKGFENAWITRPGYAIEYDYFDPQDLMPSLQTKYIEGLFFAGQINGTTGYEEAAAQGMLAGINAALFFKGQAAWFPRRDEAYIGVLVDDLITCGTQEPYRMFTSRAEYRLLLREDNADQRLTPIARSMGLIDDARWNQFERKQNDIQTMREAFSKTTIQPNSEAGEKIKTFLNRSLSRDYKAIELLRWPELNFQVLSEILNFSEMPEEVSASLEVEIKYQGYIDRQQEEIERVKRHENAILPKDFNYDEVTGLSNENREKLKRVRPENLAMASRISGVTPAAIALLWVHLKRMRDVIINE